MPSPSIQGTGIYWTIGNLTHNLPGSFNHQSAEYTANSEVKKLKNSSGVTSTLVNWDYTDELTFESDVIGSASISTATVSIPTFGTKVTVSGGPASTIATATWIVQPPCGLTFSNETECKFKCKLERYEGITPV